MRGRLGLSKRQATFKGRRAKEEREAYAFILPSLLGLTFFVFIPLFMTFLMSLTRFDLANLSWHWIGIVKYKDFLSDPVFRDSLINTFKYCVIYVPLTLSLGLSMAIVLNSKLYLKSVIRTFFIIPYVSTYIASIVVWMMLLDPNNGPINALLMKFGMTHPPVWLADPFWSMVVLAVIGSWKDVGFHFIIFLAALQTVPKHLYEAARIDGASSWKQFRHITLPMISPTTFMLLIITINGGLQMFTQSYVMTHGGPGYATMTLVYLIFRSAFEMGDFSYASAVGVVLFIISIFIVIIQWKLNKKWVSYES